MLRCSKCGQYYVPSYLDCQCRVASHMRALANASLSLKDGVTSWSGLAKSAHELVSSLGMSQSSNILTYEQSQKAVAG